MFIFPVMYIARGAALGKSLSYWEKVNWAWTICTNACMIYFCGLRGFLYLVASTWLGYGLHPAAVHFIQEHYTFLDGQETYSYYGSGNLPFLNIGYHNEHHDFAAVPWSKLPDIKQRAREFYDPLQHHTSWLHVIWTFLTESEFGPQSRVERTPTIHRDGRAMMKKRL